MKNGKSNFGFSYILNMANFDAFCWVISSSINTLFLKSDVLVLKYERSLLEVDNEKVNAIC